MENIKLIALAAVVTVPLGAMTLFAQVQNDYQSEFAAAEQGLAHGSAGGVSAAHQNEHAAPSATASQPANEGDRTQPDAPVTVPDSVATPNERAAEQSLEATEPIRAWLVGQQPAFRTLTPEEKRTRGLRP